MNEQEPSLAKCCRRAHPFETADVQARWPRDLKCLIVGESPGSPGSDYFYDPVPSGGRDPVEVRRYLLLGLTRIGLISTPSLEAFRDSGFLFDHAIRCQLPSEVIAEERRRARLFRSARAHEAHHLVPLIDAVPKVWLMGAMARDAAAYLYEMAPAEFQRTLDPPGVVQARPKFFVSRYLNRYAEQGHLIGTILEAFRRFLGA